MRPWESVSRPTGRPARRAWPGEDERSGSFDFDSRLGFVRPPLGSGSLLLRCVRVRLVSRPRPGSFGCTPARVRLDSRCKRLRPQSSPRNLRPRSNSPAPAQSARPLLMTIRRSGGNRSVSLHDHRNLRHPLPAAANGVWSRETVCVGPEQVLSTTETAGSLLEMALSRSGDHLVHGRYQTVMRSL